VSFFDKKFGELFPTRTGTPIGTANERQMLDAIGGSDGFRTRIQKDAATGLETILRTKNGMPQFSNLPQVQIETDLPIFMDSGAIDLNGMGTESPERFNNGILHYGTNQRLYQSLKQLLGKLWPKSMRCEPPSENATAFSFEVKPDTFGARDQDLLDVLYAKKLAIAFAGPSMFCGKARLYAQAQYGRELQAWAWRLSAGGTFQLDSKVSAAKLTTNSGIYLDTEFRHWLLDIDNAGVKITKLKRDARVTPIVKKWLETSPGHADYDKLEAYILAYSLPDASNSFWIAIPGNPGCDMFGYGWKFNWSGTSADIIRTDVIPAGGITFKYRSTHYRVSFNRDTSTSIMDEKSRWSAVLQTVEGPAEWKSDKWAQVIASPLWGENVLEIFGELWGPRFGDAPVYCFYKRDSLEVFRYTMSGGQSAVEYMVEPNPVTWAGRYDWALSKPGYLNIYGSIGLEDASAEERARTNRAMVTGFYSESTSSVMPTEGYTYRRSGVSNKTWGGTTDWFSGNSQHYTVNLANSIVGETLVGYLNTYGGGTTPYYIGGSYQPGAAVDLGSVSYRVTHVGTISMRRFDYNGTHSETGYIALIIPFFDAEAAYSWGQKDTYRTETGAQSYGSGDSTGLTYVTDYELNGVAITVYGGGTSNLSPAATMYPHTPDPTNTSSIICNSLVTSTGAHQFYPTTSMAPFFSGTDTSVVEQTWTTRVSLEGAVFGQGVRVLLGFDNFVSPLPFVGWA